MFEPTFFEIISKTDFHRRERDLDREIESIYLALIKRFLKRAESNPFALE